jgi:peptide/nickel transport system permease protein
MRAVKAMSVVLQRSIVSLLLMLGATSIIFFSLRAAPGTAVDAYSSLSTPKEDLAQLRQDLGFTIVEPLMTASGQAVPVSILSVEGAYEGLDTVAFELAIESQDANERIYRFKWKEGDGSFGDTHVIGVSDEVTLSAGFRVKLNEFGGLNVGTNIVFGAVNLDERPIQAFYVWLSKVFVGDFGQSQVISQGSPVMSIAAPAFLRTLLLAAGALLTCMLLASAYVVLRSGGRPSGRFAGLGAIMGAAPSFVVGLFVMLVVNQVVYYYWNPEIYVPPRWWPVPKIFEGEFVFAPTLFAGLSILLGDGLMADYANGFRADYGRVRSAPFIAAIRSKGASVTRHVVRNMIVPTVDAFAGRLPLVLGSVIIVENMFGLSGGGWYLLEAAKERDVPLVVGLSVLFTGTGILTNLLADVMKTAIDPREADHGA